jgi:hypothetical protein
MKELKEETKKWINDTIIFLAGLIWGIILSRLPITVEQYLLYTSIVLIMTYFMYIKSPLKNMKRGKTYG